MGDTAAQAVRRVSFPPSIPPPIRPALSHACMQAQVQSEVLCQTGLSEEIEYQWEHEAKAAAAAALQVRGARCVCVEGRCVGEVCTPPYVGGGPVGAASST